MRLPLFIKPLTAMLIAIGLIIIFNIPPVTGAVGDSPKNIVSGPQSDSVSVLEKISFHKVRGKERVIISLSKRSPFKTEELSGKAVLIKFEDTFVPDDLRRPVGEGQLENVYQAMADQKTINDKQWVFITIDLKERVPYSIKQNGSNIYLDFNTASLSSLSRSPQKNVNRTSVSETGQSPATTKDTEIGIVNIKPTYTGQKVTLDFQDASIKSVLRLLSEVSGKNIVAGEDVKGNVTVTMKNIPWDHALDTILALNSLSKVESGNVIQVLTTEKYKKDSEERRKADEAIKEEEKKRKEEEVKRLVEQGKLRQIAIEAKIVEATDLFIRNLGIRWGGLAQGRAGDYPYGFSFGTNPSQNRAVKWSYADGLNYLDSDTSKAMMMTAVNYPSAVAGPTIGMVMGGSQAVFEAQLQALESTSQGKIISSPKVTTMDNVKATIEQGEEIPYITPASGTSPATVTFKKAVLRLEVKPTITSEGKISMEIMATNDFADYSRAAELQGNPPIKMSRVDSKVSISDGDTIVIGGVLRTEDTKAVSGVPWLSKIPVLGWLFKEEDLTKSRRQLLIFVTPKIVKGSSGDTMSPSVGTSKP